MWSEKDSEDNSSYRDVAPYVVCLQGACVLKRRLLSLRLEADLWALQQVGANCWRGAASLWQGVGRLPVAVNPPPPLSYMLSPRSLSFLSNQKLLIQLPGREDKAAS